MADFLNQLLGPAPWIWYISRASALVGFLFLWLTIFLGLAIRNPWLKKIVAPIYSFDFHCFTAALAVAFGLVHGTILLLDPVIGFSTADVLIPFWSQTTSVNVTYLALGILAFYMLAVMTLTSYLKRDLNHKLWRALHFLSPLAFIFIVLHGYVNGTDMKNIYVGGTFIASSFVLVAIYLSSLVFAILTKMHKNNLIKPPQTNDSQN